MLFRQLEYFVAVTAEKHFARAAKACHVSQPALSTAIAKLERELNVTLINRGHNYRGLTPEGERLVVWAKRMLAEQAAFKVEVAAVRSGVTGTLRLGAEPTASTTLASPVAAFCARHPLAKVRMHSGLSTTDLRRRLLAFELDAAIGHFTPGDREGLQVLPLYTERYLLLAPEELVHRVDAMNWAEAAQLPLALLTPDMGLRQVIDRVFGECGATVDPRLETDSVAALYAHVGVGACASIVPHTWSRVMPTGAGLRAVRLVEPDARAQVSVAIHATGPGSLAARAFASAAAGLSLDTFFDQALPTEYRAA
jgi:DNA-binding transcriptional LysR family regulator